MSDRTREHALLFQCARSQLPPASVATVRELAAAADWGYLAPLAEAHLVWPMMLRNLQAAEARTPHAVVDRWRQLMIATTMANLALTSQLTNVLRLFDAHGIPAAAWKGPTFAVRAYGAIGLRTSGDLDILVPDEAIGDVRRLMLANGYTLSDRTRHAFDGLVPATGREYEFVPEDGRLSAVETQISSAPWVLGVRLRARDLVDRAVPVVVAGHRIRTLCAEDLLLAVALHGANHMWSQLRLISDIDATALTALDWDIVMTRARSACMARILAVALLLAHDLLKTALPDEVLTAVQKDRAAARLSAHLNRKLFAPVSPLMRHLWRDWIYLRSREHVSDRLRYGFRQLAFEHVIRHSDRVMWLWKEGPLRRHGKRQASC